MKESEKTTFGAGCFWCVEAVFQRLEGVKDVVPGYCGGDKDNPTYEEVCTGMTGHAEVAQITFDPTTLNRQGNDVGTQYRSAIFYHNEEQRSAAERSKEKFDNSEIFSNQIVTEIIALDQFWPAEDYHNNYYINNPNQPYCRIVIKPKLDKLFKK